MPDLARHVDRDGSIDYEYTWDRPVTTYLSTLEHLRLLLLRARLSAAADPEYPEAADARS